MTSDPQDNQQDQHSIPMAQIRKLSLGGGGPAWRSVGGSQLHLALPMVPLIHGATHTAVSA